MDFTNRITLITVITNSNNNSSQITYGNSSNCATSNSKSESTIKSKATKVEDTHQHNLLIQLKLD